MKVTIKITSFEARSFHNLIHTGVHSDSERINYGWITNNADKRTYLEELHVIYKTADGGFQLTKFGVQLRKAFGNWQPASDNIFDDRAFKLTETLNL